MSGVNSQRLLESRRNELHLFLRALNKRIVEGSLHTYLTVNHVTHPPVTSALPQAQAALTELRDHLRTVAQNTGTAVFAAVEALTSSEVWRFEQSLTAAKSSALNEITGMINQAFEKLQAAGTESDQDAVLQTAIGVESVTTTVMVFLAQLCTTLVERRDKLLQKGASALSNFAVNAFESLSKWIGAILPSEAMATPERTL